MTDQEKDLRREKVVDMHNSGNSIKEIMDSTKMSRSGIYKILDKVLPKGEVPPKEIVEVKLTGQEERFTNFSGWVRTNVNEYANKDTGETVRVVFVKATEPDQFGYFVKL